MAGPPDLFHYLLCKGMGWELTIRGDSSGAPAALGARDTVRGHFAARLPGVNLAPWTQAFQDHMRARSIALSVPYFSLLEGYYERDDLVIEFHCADAETIIEVSANVRGNSDPLPPLRALCSGTSWVIVEDATGQLILGEAEAGNACSKFKRWREQSISNLSKYEGPNA